MAQIALAAKTIFTAAGAAGAAGAATAGIGSKLIGGLVAGIGSGMMKKAQYRAEEKSRIDEENRRAERYAGAGQATRFWEEEGKSAENPPSGSYGFQRVDPNSNRNKSLGEREETKRIGDQYRKPKSEKPRYRYDRDAGAIVMS